MFQSGKHIPVIRFLSSFVEEGSLASRSLCFLAGKTYSDVSRSCIGTHHMSRTSVAYRGKCVRHLNRIVVPLAGVTTTVGSSPRLAVFTGVLGHFYIPICSHSVADGCGAGGSANSIISSIFI